jgi:hypothetical protein
VVVVGELDDPEWVTTRAMTIAAMAMMTATMIKVRLLIGDGFFLSDSPGGGGGRFSTVTS